MIAAGEWNDTQVGNRDFAWAQIDVPGETVLDVLDTLVNTDGPYPVDQAEMIGTNASRRRPYDWVFADEDLETYEVPVQVGSNIFPSELVFDSRVSSVDLPPKTSGDTMALWFQRALRSYDYELLATIDKCR